MTVNTVRELLENAAAADPEKTALIFGPERYSYRELLERVDRIAHYLTTLKLPRGSRIGIYSDKSPEQVVAILAILSTEHLFVPITRLLKPEQVQHIIEDCGIACIVTDAKKIATVRKTGFEGRVLSYTPTSESDVSFEEIYKCTPAEHRCQVRGHDNAAITYTFGSSGDPRGIVIDHRGFYDGAAIVA